MINKEVVSLTGELHEHTEYDDERLRDLVREVASVANDVDFEEAVIQEASLLVYRIASGQHFHEGNKRTALVAGAAFLKMNGYTIALTDEELVRVADKAGVAGATLNEVHDVMKRLVKNVTERT